jgi:hypothetical protein
MCSDEEDHLSRYSTDDLSLTGSFDDITPFSPSVLKLEDFSPAASAAQPATPTPAHALMPTIGLPRFKDTGLLSQHSSGDSTGTRNWSADVGHANQSPSFSDAISRRERVQR